jgi:hypothetical protein
MMLRLFNDKGFSIFTSGGLPWLAHLFQIERTSRKYSIRKIAAEYWRVPHVRPAQRANVGFLTAGGWPSLHREGGVFNIQLYFLVRRFDMTRKLVPFTLLILGLCFSASSCRKAPPIWSAESKSPDGKMIATARTYEQSGFGTGWTQTTVNLNWTAGSQPPALILAFSDGPSEPGGMNISMTWLTVTRLELIYKGRRPIDFQAVKCDGIDISVRDTSLSP